MTKNFRWLLPYAALASCLGACTKVTPAPEAPPGPPTEESYTTRLLKVQAELTDLGTHTVAVPQSSGDFEIACKCAVILKPDFRIPIPSPPPQEAVRALERGLAALLVVVEASKAGKLPEVITVPQPQ